MAATAAEAISYFQHVENGAVHGYDTVSIEAALRNLPTEAELKAGTAVGRKRHHLEEQAIQVRRRILVPCAAPAPRTVEVPGEMVEHALAEERRLRLEKLEREAAELRALGVGDPSPTPPVAEDADLPFGDLPDELGDLSDVSSPAPVEAAPDAGDDTPKPRGRARRAG